MDALKKAGCEKIFTDTTSGAEAERPGLTKAIEMLRKGDILVGWCLDRLGRSLKDLIAWVTHLKEGGIGFKSLQESIDTTTPGVFYFSFSRNSYVKNNFIYVAAGYHLFMMSARFVFKNYPQKIIIPPIKLYLLQNKDFLSLK